MNITILFVGTKHEYIDRMIAEYAGRFQYPFSLTCEAIRPVPKQTGQLQRAAESDVILQKLDRLGGALVIALDETGKSYTSPAFSRILESESSNWRSAVFVIGGSYGFDDRVRSRAQYVVSLSQMVLQHDIARLVLAEQIYRAVDIIRGGKYHHA